MKNNIEEELHFYKKNKKDKIWWVYRPDEIGGLEISFDCDKIYNLWKDYPHNLTKEEKEVFDKENPYWKEFFEGR